METKDLNNPVQPESNLDSAQQAENMRVNEPSEENETLETDTPEVEPSNEPAPEAEVIDLEALSREELIARAEVLLKTQTIESAGREIEMIRTEFYKKHNQHLHERKSAAPQTEEHENEPLSYSDPLELRMKELYQEFKNKKYIHNQQLEKEKESNLEQKLAVIEAIKELVNRQESLHNTFNEFRELQARWSSIGHVPQDKMHDLYESYNLSVENFYAYIKINKELRDLDFKKNLEAKTELCEKAEKLVLEPSVVKAFQTLQKFHEQWREIGPVPNEKKEEIWERFKEATSLINKKHQEHFEGMKEQLQKNLEAKTELCEKAEALLASELSSPKEWEEKSNELIELQNIWKTIGFAPKKENTLIYERFRQACDKFFDAKRDFFKTYKSDQMTNLQLKTELCIEAENLKDSTDWKKTTDSFIKIQKKWKEIGAVPRKHSDTIWKRFRSACDYFFEQKNKFFSKIDQSQEENLNLKRAIIEEVKQFENSDDTDANFKKLQDFQHRWSEIGHVPIAEKENINQEFRSLINKHFDSLNLDEFNKNIQKFKNKLENYKTESGAKDKINVERNKIIAKIKQLENDITLWENNIGFFAKSKKSDALIRDFNHKIETNKKNIELLNKKLDMIDDESK
jgi:putative ubiquitin-RnfH superfamily antitoxin RatB of RatAB toxin-antitoxin module